MPGGPMAATQQRREGSAAEPLPAPVPARTAAVRGSPTQVAAVILFGTLYILVSAGLIGFNKYLMHKDRFPFAVPLVMLHMALCFCLTGVLYLVQPKMFPSLSDPASKVEIDRGIIFKGALPIGFFFAAQLVLSNTAYMHSSMAFLQMMKEANLVLVYAFSVLFSMEVCSKRSLGILCAIVVATTMTIHGEVNFSLKGFVIQGTSQLFESFKIVLQALLLSSAGKKLDALTYVLLVAPLSLAILSVAFSCLIYNPNEHIELPSLAQMVAWWPVLLVNSIVAFTLNVVTALFFKHTSAVAFILAGIVKDAAIVAAGAFVFREVISGIQVFGFVLQLLFIVVWSLTKTFPDYFEAGVITGLHALLTGNKALVCHIAEEKIPLLNDRKHTQCA
eukprot:TRINITY_DN31168_c0_g1_i1.p1 TRINITY_DN31168_c0_g1~~TRINITY_DN31168_c0_g1_i1.p1  ORF type:complete len:390 (-),score=94.87 TRINITY_DN31168_c0_g1_i1:67-1236(-)